MDAEKHFGVFVSDESAKKHLLLSNLPGCFMSCARKLASHCRMMKCCCNCSKWLQKCLEFRLSVLSLKLVL